MTKHDSFSPRDGSSIWRTMRIPLVIAVFMIATGARAQEDRTGTGGGPLSTQTAPNTTATGETMPPDRADSPTTRKSPDRRTREDREMDRIDDSICIGCEPK